MTFKDFLLNNPACIVELFKKVLNASGRGNAGLLMIAHVHGFI